MVKKPEEFEKSENNKERRIESVKYGLKEISGPALNRIGCGIIGGIIVAYLSGKSDISQYWGIISWGLFFFISGAVFEHLTEKIMSKILKAF